MSASNAPKSTSNDDYAYAPDEDYFPDEAHGYESATDATAALPAAPVHEDETETEDDVVAAVAAASQPAGADNFYGKVPDEMSIPQAARQKLTGLGLGGRFRIHYQDKAAFRRTKNGGSWYTYDGKVWTEDIEMIQINAWMRTVIVSISEDEPRWAADSDEAVREAEAALALATAIGDAKTIAAQAAAVERARDRAVAARKKFGEQAESSAALLNIARTAAMDLLSVPDSYWDGHKDWINVQNGVVNLRSGKLMDHSPTHYMTKITSVDWKPEARSKDLQRILDLYDLSDPGHSRYLQRYVGTGVTGYATAKAFTYIDGIADAAKSTLMDSVIHALGDVDGNGYGRIAEAEMFTIDSKKAGGQSNSQLHSMRGARIIVMDEAESAGFLQSKEVKKHCSGGMAMSRDLYEKSQSWESQSSIVFIGNGRILLADNDAGMQRRLTVMKLVHAVPDDEMDTAVEDRLKKSVEGREAVLAWAIQGAIEWLAEGADKKALHITDRMEIEKADYLSDSDPLGPFWAHCVREVEPAAKDYLPLKTGTWFKLYADYCKARGQGTKMNEQRFGERLTQRGFPIKDTSRTVVINGEKIPASGKLRLGLSYYRTDLTEFVERNDY